MRALEPSSSGVVTRDGVDIGYEVFGEESERTIVISPVNPIVHSRAWKMQVPFLARRAKVIAVDPRGNGRSGRPRGLAAYADAEFAADTIAVMDHLDASSAVFLALCKATWTSLLIAARDPHRVEGMVAISPWIPYTVPALPWRAGIDLDDELEVYEGWAKENRHYITAHYRDYLDFYFSELLPEPHSSKARDDCVAWGLGTVPDIRVELQRAPLSVDRIEGVDQILGHVRCPVLVVNGDADRVTSAEPGAYLAKAVNADRLVISGAGHLPMVREPVAVNLAIRDFLDRVWRAPRQHTWSVPWRRQRRVLYLSSPIGLGHGRRDLAIAGELRKLHPDLHVDWLAQPPLTGWLRRCGESVHPASTFLASEAAHIDAAAGEHDLHAFSTIREMDEILVANFMVFAELAEAEQYDLWVGDEAWELDHFLFDNPELKTTAYCWVTDFVGWLPNADADAREIELTTDYNAEMLEQVARLPRVRDRAVFVGRPDDIAPQSFGADLPDIRKWTEQHYDFSGYITGFDADEVADRAALRNEFGFGGEPVCVVTVGGSGVGTALLRRAAETYPALAERLPGIRMILATGPRIDPASLPAFRDVEVRGWLPDLHRMLAAADVALVQGGLTTTMELTAARRPFVYVPLQHHFEQNIHVHHRLQRHGAGHCVPWRDATSTRLADALACALAEPLHYRPVDTDGAARAAQLLGDLL